MMRALGVLAVLLLTPWAAAKTTLTVAFGFEGQYRIGHWTPVYITAADDRGPARNVVLEIVAPHDRSFSIRIRQALTLRPDPQTFLLYVPLTYSLSDTVATLRDPNTGRILAEEDFERAGGPNFSQRPYYGGEGEVIIGVAGNPRSLRALEGRWQENVPIPGQPNSSTTAMSRTMVGGIDYRFLPDSVVGYESLDLLVLSAPNLINLSSIQQEAIATWVRRGGRLLVWFGPHVVPTVGPIAELLPCAVGDATTIELSEQESADAGLPRRAGKLAGRILEPRAGTQHISLLGGKGSLVAWRVGLGQAGVLSFDASQLTFDSSTADDSKHPARIFWSPVLAQLMPDLHSQIRRMDMSANLRVGAVHRVVDRLGDVPGVGTFDFSYIALVMIGMMLIVGPVDWFVLRKLGRQPWTWATTAGWIGLVTTGALYLGYVLRSGDLHFRTLRVIDQADGQVIAVNHAVGIYSPKTQRYELEAPRDNWWKPTSIDPPHYWRPARRTASQITLHQDQRGTAPDEMTINVWHLRFMESQQAPDAQDKPLIQASLQRTTRDGKARIIGTITNLSDKPMRDVYVKTKEGIAPICLGSAAQPSQAGRRRAFDVGDARPALNAAARSAKGAFEQIAPGQTVQVDVEIIPEHETLQSRAMRGYGPYQDGASTEGALYPFQQAACELDMPRAMQVENMLNADGALAVLIAETEADASPVMLHPANGMPALQKHWRVVRALVRMEQ